jgi:murein L,D-transpeptidase YcbB/YkuD
MAALGSILMNARTSLVFKPLPLLVLLVAGLLLFLSRPAAQTNNDFPIDFVLRDAKIVADFMGNPAFVVGDEAVDGDALIRFYSLRDSRLAWSGTPRTLANAAIAIRALSSADEHGLDRSRYHLRNLADSSAALSKEDAAIHDLLLTDAILIYARELRIGTPSAADRDTDLPVQEFDAVSSLNTALEAGTLAEFLAGLAPPHPEYKRLFAALGHYRKLADEGIEAAERVDQIIANMERWRWLPHRLETRRVMVNAADATLEVIDNDQVILRSKVVVGTADSPTPIFRAVATGVTVNPPWNVPASIASNEFLPKLRSNPNFLLSQNIVLLNGPADDPHGTRIDWNRVSPEAFPYRLQQPPGAGDALGQLKIEMPNAFSVYLHDTPGKREFARTERNLSHGCVRVEQILPLASIALSGDAMAAATTLTGAVTSGKTQYLALKQPMPVYVLYWTVIGDGDGTVQFRRDVYGRDARLLHTLRAARTASIAFFTGDCRRAAG